MFSRLLSSLSKNTLRLKQSVRLSHNDITYKGQNIPFDISCPRRLAIKMTIFFGIPFAMPFIIVRYHLMKSSGQLGGGGAAPKAGSTQKQKFY